MKQSQELRNRHISAVISSSAERPGHSTVEQRRSLGPTALGPAGGHGRRTNPDAELTPFTEINSASPAARNIKQETATLPEDDTGKPGDLGYGDDCLDVIAGTRPLKEITDKRNCTKTKTSDLRKTSQEHDAADTTDAHDTTPRGARLGTGTKAGGRAHPAGQAGSTEGHCARTSPSQAGTTRGWGATRLHGIRVAGGGLAPRCTWR